MKLLRTMCVLGLALCLTTSVYAGTQSVKISGDLTVRGFARDDYDLDYNHSEPATQGQVVAAGTNPSDPQPGTSDWQTWFMTTTELQIDADLTDNVSAVIRLFNQRDWNVRDKSINPNTRNYNLTTIYTANADEFDVGVDLAYIELKEFLYSPLTLRIGRQDIWMGKGFVVGGLYQDPTGAINATEYSCVTSFDAIRATLDYDPWTIDALAAVIQENEIGSRDNEILMGVNVGYIFDMYNAEAEGYWFNKQDRGMVPPAIIKQHNTVHTVGLRGSADPIENWTVAAEGAYQFGDFVGFRDQANGRDRSAYALDVSAECRYLRDQYAWKPVLGVEYILYSGDDDDYPDKLTEGTYGGWDIMYRGKFNTAYRDYVGLYNFTHLGWVGARNDYAIRFTDTAWTNQQQVLVTGSVMPTDSLTVDGTLGFFWVHHKRAFPANITDPSAGNPNDHDRRKAFLGTEVDVELTWDYTEDVSFGLLAAWFFPGGFYYDQSDDPATDLVGAVKLSF